ncbi:hypothetical protein ENBRE01_3045 [Enteropsectra breve]|nr:hypothetical protein ENBRE01_3045 [Enteropsectra breve]
MPDLTEEKKDKILAMCKDEKERRIEYLYSLPRLNKQEFVELCLLTGKHLLNGEKVKLRINFEHILAQLKEILENTETLVNYADRYPLKAPIHCQAVDTFLRPFDYSDENKFVPHCIANEEDYISCTVCLMEQENMKGVRDMLQTFKIDHVAYEKYLLRLIVTIFQGTVSCTQEDMLTTFETCKVYLVVHLFVTGKAGIVEEISALDAETIETFYMLWFKSLSRVITASLEES